MRGARNTWETSDPSLEIHAGPERASFTHGCRHRETVL
jgi:hypothetical protein